MIRRAAQNGFEHRNRVLVWRTNWLPSSNTFVRDQIAAYQRWEAVSFGLVREPHPLVEPDRHVFGSGSIGSLARRRLPDSTQFALAAWSARRLRPMLVHAHFGTDALTARPVATRLGVPLVVTFHGYDVTALAGREEYAAHLSELVGEVDLLVAVSDFIAGKLRDMGANPARILTHHTGIPVTPPCMSDRERAGVLFVGRLVEKKGLADLIIAYARLDPELRKVHPLTIVGEGPLEEAMRGLANDLQVAPVFTGPLASTDVAQYFERCAVACVPSKRAASGDSEGLPTVILEAASHRAPVIASIHAGNAEAVHDGRTGLLFPEGDVDALLDRLDRLLSQESLRGAMGDAGRRLIEVEFDIRKQSRLLEAAYDRLIA